MRLGCVPLAQMPVRQPSVSLEGQRRQPHALAPARRRHVQLQVLKCFSSAANSPQAVLWTPCSLRPHVVRATTVKEDDAGGNAGDVEFAAAAGCRAGQQMFHMYSSDLSNAELLLSYGFTIPANENDTVLVEIEQPEEAWRTRLLPFIPQHYLTRGAPVPLQLLHAVALADCTKLELKSRLKDGVWAVAVQQRARQLLVTLLQVRQQHNLFGLPEYCKHVTRPCPGQARAAAGAAASAAS